MTTRTSLTRYASVCSGIGSPEVAWSALGWRSVFASEIDRFPSAVLAARFPDTPNYGDMRRFEDWPDAAIDVFVGGTPCQDFSVAGLRAGLAGDRANLALVYLEIARRYRPRWLVWENVPGVLSSNGGRDFGAILGGMGILGYGVSYRVLDAQFFELAQRRARVFVVGYLGDWRAAAAVLFEREGLSGHPAPRREAREDVAGTIAGGARKRGGYSSDDIPAVPTLARCVTAREGARQDYETETLIAHTLRAEGFDASEDGTGRGIPLVPIAFDTTQITSKTNRSQPAPGRECHPLSAEGHPPAIAFTCKDHGADAGELAPTLRAMGHYGSHANAGGQVAVAFGISSDAIDRTGEGDGSPGQRAGLGIVENASPSLRSAHVNAVATSTAVRRLTPRECERLQGFPDDFTAITYRGKPAADGPRYKALGNSMAVPVMRWIGRRIELVNGLVAETANESVAA